MYSVRTGISTRRAGWLACILLCLPVAVSAATVNPRGPTVFTVTENVQIAQSNRPIEDREAAIQRLANITAQEDRDNKVCETLLAIAKDPNGNLILRIAAVQTLGSVQTNVTKDDRAKTLYREPFLAMLRNNKELTLVRMAIASVFRDTLSPGNLSDRDKVLPVLADLARNRNEPISVRVNCTLAVGAVGNDDAIEVLAAVLTDVDPDLREAAAKAINDLLLKNGSAAISVPAVARLVGIFQDKTISIDLRIAVMKTLAQLIRDGNVGARNGALSIILETPKNGLGAVGSEFDAAVLGGIEALGIIGSPEAVGPLREAYKANFDPAAPEKSVDVAIRQAVIRALGVILSFQAEQKTPDMKVVKIVREALVEPIDKDPVAAIKSTAVFELRYLYRPEFTADQRDAADAILHLLEKEKNPELIDRCFKTLVFISGRDYNRNLRRWNEWYDKTFGKTAPK